MTGTEDGVLFESEATILVVDDEEVNVLLLEQMLTHAGYRHLVTTTDARTVRDLVEAEHPDIVLLDLLMPHLDGYQVMRQLNELLPNDDYLPILILTADTTPEALQRSLAGGASDFLTKPFDRTEVLLRMRNLLARRFLHRSLRAHRDNLETEVQARTRDLQVSHLEMLDRLATVTELRDFETGEHTQRVGRTARAIAQVLQLGAEEVRLIARAAPLHDVGKIATPDSILLKPGRLTPDEFEEVKKHTTAGAQILSDGRFPLLRTAEEIALMHHERWDGTGYAGVAGTQIPRSARITAIADVFDALTHARPYKEAWSVDRAVEEIASQRGRHFEPDVVDAFFTAMDKGGLLDEDGAVRDWV